MNRLRLLGTLVGFDAKSRMLKIDHRGPGASKHVGNAFQACSKKNFGACGELKFFWLLWTRGPLSAPGAHYASHVILGSRGRWGGPRAGAGQKTVGGGAGGLFCVKVMKKDISR